MPKRASHLQTTMILAMVIASIAEVDLMVMAIMKMQIKALALTPQIQRNKFGAHARAVEKFQEMQ